MTTWFRPHLSPAEQARVLADREAHPDPAVRRRLLVLWAVHLGHSRPAAARLAHVGIATAKRSVLAYRDGGLDALTERAPPARLASQLADHAAAIEQSLTAQPVRTTAEAVERIATLTGLRRGLTQTRTFLAGLGFTWQRTRAVPVPPKSP